MTSELPIVVLGAGGHGKVVADILLAAKRRVVGFLDAKTPAGTLVLGLPVLGDDDWLADNRGAVALGIGDNATRERVALRLVERGVSLVTAIHPSAVVAVSARVADGVVIAALAAVNPEATVHRGVIVNTGAVVEHDCSVGAFAHLATNATTGGGCTIGRMALLGSGATMLPGRSIGDSTVIGSGSVVTRNILDGAVARGIPARVTPRRD